MSYIVKNQEPKKDDRFALEGLSINQKVTKYQELVKNFTNIKNKHKEEINIIREIKKNSESVSKFKLDEMQKKMKNEIFRLSEECKRHNETQKVETQKVRNQIGFVEDTFKEISKVLKDILDRVTVIEANIGPSKK
jgi:hypothetical protein